MSDRSEPERAQLATGKRDRGGQRRVGTDRVDERILHEPIDFGIRVCSAQADQQRYAAADIAQCTGPDHQYAFRNMHSLES